MKKRILAFSFSVFILFVVTALYFNSFETMVGTAIVSHETVLIVPDGETSSIVIANTNLNFDEVDTGDKIKVSFDGKIMESFPSQMNASKLEILEKGKISNVPSATLDMLKELNWDIT